MSDVYVRYTDRPVARTLEDTRTGITVDLDDEGELIGVELMGACAVEIDGEQQLRELGR